MTGEELRSNPYVGLRPFFKDDNLYFFGREQQTRELLEILRQHRFVGVVGSSGSGKSSLVRAGLLPGLLGGFLVEDRDHWRTVEMKPGDAPLANLSMDLLTAMGETATIEAAKTLEREIRENHTAAVLEFVAARLESNASLFLLVDQFEEIFAFRGADEEEGPTVLDPGRRKERAQRRAEATDFVDLLIALAEQKQLPIYVALTMRTDFLGDCDLFYGLPEALNRGRYLVPRLTREQLRDCVECPALLLGAQVGPRLLDFVLNELGDRFDRLPVLQHALLRTWDEWQRNGGIGPLDLRDFEAAGGLEGALGQDAEGAMRGLDAGAVERVFKRLTDTDLSQRRGRSPARISELVAASGAGRPAGEMSCRRCEEDGRSFVHASPDGKPEDPRVDISHESLIRQWERLRNWVDEERQSRDEYRELVKKARKRERKEVGLLQNPELKIVDDWRKKVGPSPGWAKRYSVSDGDFDSAMRYLNESLAEVELGRRWQRLWNPLILVVEAIGVVSLGTRGRGEPKPTDVLRELNKFGHVERNAPSVHSTHAWTELWDILVSRGFVSIVLFLGACFALNLGIRWIHRRFALPRILRRIATAGRLSPVQVKAKAEDTGEAVVIQHTTYASTYSRFAGFWIDAVVFLVDAIIVIALEIAADAGNVGYVPMTLILVAGALFSFLYSTLQIASRRQATLGMHAVGIFRTDMHGGRLSFARASRVYGYRLLSWAFYGVGFIIQPFMKNRQTFHDKMAGSVVLQCPLPTIGPKIAPTIGPKIAPVGAIPQEAVAVHQTTYASPYRRLAGGVIDAIPFVLLAYVLGFAAVDNPYPGVLLIALSYWYSALQIASKRQATLGMRAVGIFRTDLNGERLSFDKASAVYGYRILSWAVFGLGFVIQPFTAKKQTLHDRLAGSVVLRAASRKFAEAENPAL